MKYNITIHINKIIFFSLFTDKSKIMLAGLNIFKKILLQLVLVSIIIFI